MTSALLGLLGALPARAAEVRLTEEDAVRLALEKNPEVRAQAIEVEAARARAEGAARLFQGNPELELAVGRRGQGGEATLEAEAQMSQPFEVGGQRGARIAAARGALGAAEARLTLRKVEVAALVREAFGRTLAGERRLALAEEALQLATQAVATAQQRQAAGAASRLEVNAARVELGRARRESRQAAQGHAAARAELVRLLSLPSDDTLQLVGELGRTASPAPDTQRLAPRALEAHPELAAARLELEEAQAEARLASREAIPTPRLGVAYAREEDARILQGTLGVELPLFDRNQAERGKTAAQTARARLALEAAERSVLQEVRLATARLEAAEAAARDFSEDVITAAHENLELIQEAYAAGKVDFLQLLLVRRDTLEARRGHIEALEELHSARGQLSRALGVVDELER